MYRDVPLTSEQRDFAEDNHELVYRFLHKNHLSVDDYYDVAIFGYLRAVKHYTSDPALQNFQFSTIAFQEMLGELRNYNKAINRKTRGVEIRSIFRVKENEMLLARDCTTMHGALSQEFEAELLLYSLASKISDQQMKIVRMKASGYSLREIAQKQNTTVRAIKVLLEEVYLLLTQMCQDTE